MPETGPKGKIFKNQESLSPDMADFNLIQKIKSRMDSKEKEVDVLLAEIWGHFRDVLNGKHEDEKIHKTMSDQIIVITGHMKNAEESIRKGNYGSAARWLESAESGNKVIEEFDEVIEKMERKELENIIIMRSKVMGLRNKIRDLKRNIEEAQKRAA
jgi:hypothetical protein